MTSDQDGRPDAIGDATGRRLDRVTGEVGVPGGGAYAPMPEELADHGKALSEGEGAGREGVTKIVDADVLEAGPGAEDLPRVLEVLQRERPGSARR